MRPRVQFALLGFLVTALLALQCLGQPGGPGGGGRGGMGGGPGGMGGGPGGMGGGPGGMGGGPGGMGGVNGISISGTSMDFGGGLTYNPSQMQQTMLDSTLRNLQLQLNATDDEWKVLKPRLEIVYLAKNDAGGSMSGIMGMMGGMGRGRGRSSGMRGQQGNSAEQSEATRLTNELQALLDDSSASPSTIYSKLMEVRAAQQRADNKVKAAQRELLQLLTARQEATLFMAGLLN
jgi:hypothetical protein